MNEAEIVLASNDPDRTINIKPQPFSDFTKALEHAAGRVRLAQAEHDDAARDVERLRVALNEASALQERCYRATHTAAERLNRLAATGRVDAYCSLHDLFFTYTPVILRKPDGTVDHYTDPRNKQWDGAPPCPECASHLQSGPAPRVDDGCGA